MKFFTSFFESRASKQSKIAEVSAKVDSKGTVSANARQVALAKQEAHDKDAIAQAYLHYGPRVARHMARNIKKTSSKEGHTCPRSEILVLH
jgi:hypothetical protein